MAPDSEKTALSKPVPRQHASSPSRLARIQAQNRRREYLQRNPSYFDSLDHELADPILYARLVKQFQTAEERAEEGKAKGYGRTLEASLIRGETNMANMSASTARGNAVASSFANLSLPDDAGEAILGSSGTAGNGTTGNETSTYSSSGYIEGSAATMEVAGAEEMASGSHAWDQPVSDKEQGLALWREFLEFRFVRGHDDDFDYGKVDEDEDLDTLQHKDAEDSWYDDEEPSWVDGDDGDLQMAKDGDTLKRRGETGVQDF